MYEREFKNIFKFENKSVINMWGVFIRYWSIRSVNILFPPTLELFLWDMKNRWQFYLLNRSVIKEFHKYIHYTTPKSWHNGIHNTFSNNSSYYEKQPTTTNFWLVRVNFSAISLKMDLFAQLTQSFMKPFLYDSHSLCIQLLE